MYKMVQYRKTNKDFEEKTKEIQEMVEKGEPSFSTKTKDHKEFHEKEGVNIRHLQEKYPDIIGWIRIPGTNIDYPIAQGKDNLFYLHHDYKGEKDPLGTVFMEVENQPDFQDQNTILYGHNVKSGKIFHELHHYRDPAFLPNAPIIEISHVDGISRYKIFAAYLANPEDNFRLPHYTDKEFETFYQRILDANRLKETLPSSFDHILTLQTCSSGNKRLVIHGYKMD